MHPQESFDHSQFSDEKDKRTLYRFTIIGGVVVLLASLIFFSWMPSGESRYQVSYSEFWQLAATGKLDTSEPILVQGQEISAKIKEGTLPGKKGYLASQLPFAADRRLYDEYTALGFRVEAVPRSFSFSEWAIFLLPYVLLIAAIGFWGYMRSGGMKGKGGTSPSGVTSGSPAARLYTSKDKVMFSDIGGIDEVLEEVEDVILFLKDPKAYVEIGVAPPVAVLFVGPEGTGKTLVAKAIANETCVPFFELDTPTAAGEMFVGVGAARVRDTFALARKTAAEQGRPVVVFMDEIDALAKDRRANILNDESHKAMLQLNIELEGINSTPGQVILFATTNKPELVDPSLMSRFRLHIMFNKPDLKGREEVLRIHTRNKPLDKDIDFVRIAKMTYGFAPRDLMNLANRAAVRARKNGRTKISNADFQAAVFDVMAGSQRNIQVSEKEKKATAYHESGHTALAEFLPHARKPNRVTIIPRAFGSGGLTHTLQTEDFDKMYYSENELLEEIIVAYGGFAAEEVMLHEKSSGAGGGDLPYARHLARNYVEWGLSSLGPIFLGQQEGAARTGSHTFGRQTEFVYSQQTKQQIDEEIKRILISAKNEAVRMIEEHREKVERLAQALLVEETLERNKIEMLLQDPPAPKGSDEEPGIVGKVVSRIVDGVKVILPGHTNHTNDEKSGS